jgi:hypothetical protein
VQGECTTGVETGGDEGFVEGVADLDPLVPLLDAEGCGRV